LKGDSHWGKDEGEGTLQDRRPRIAERGDDTTFAQKKSDKRDGGQCLLTEWLFGNAPEKENRPGFERTPKKRETRGQRRKTKTTKKKKKKPWTPFGRRWGQKKKAGPKGDLNGHGLGGKTTVGALKK